MRTFALVAVLALSAPVQGSDAPALKLPAEVSAKAATITELKAETTGKVVRWVALTPGLSLRPVDDGRTLLFAGAPGRYELLAYTALGDVPSDPARLAIVNEGVEPGPQPKPVDELRAKLAAALASDKASKSDVVQLVGIYREAVRVANDASVSTSADLLKRVRAVSKSLLGDEVLTAVRTEASGEVLAALGMSNDEPITDKQRKRAAEVYTRLADVLDSLNK